MTDWVLISDGAKRNYRHDTMLKVQVRTGLGSRDFQTDEVEITSLGGHLVVMAALYPGSEYKVWADSAGMLEDGQLCECDECMDTGSEMPASELSSNSDTPDAIGGLTSTSDSGTL